MNFRLKIIFISIILHSSFFILHSSAKAETISLGVYPPIHQINATPPANIRSPISIENRGDSTVNLTVSFKPFTVGNEEGQIKYVNNELGVDPKLVDESGQTVSEITLSPQQKKDLNLLIEIPRESVAGDYYFSIIFLTSRSVENNISSSESVSGIASNVLLSVGVGTVKGEIEEFSSPLLREHGPVLFTVRVKNTGSHFITPKGEILIKNIFGQTIGKVDLLPVNILANSVRSLPASTDASQGGPASWPQNFLLGPYKATLSITLSDTGPLFKRSIFFFALPVKGLIATAIGALFLIYITAKVRAKI